MILKLKETMHKPKFRLFNVQTSEVFQPKATSADGYRTWMALDAEGRLMIVRVNIMIQSDISVKFVETDSIFKMSFFTGRTAPLPDSQEHKDLFAGDILKMTHTDPYCAGKTITYNVLVDIVSGAPGFYNLAGRFLGFQINKEIEWTIVGNIYNNSDLLNEVQLSAWYSQNK